MKQQYDLQLITVKLPPSPFSCFINIYIRKWVSLTYSQSLEIEVLYIFCVYFYELQSTADWLNCNLVVFYHHHRQQNLSLYEGKFISTITLNIHICAVGLVYKMIKLLKHSMAKLTIYFIFTMSHQIANKIKTEKFEDILKFFAPQCVAEFAMKILCMSYKFYIITQAYRIQILLCVRLTLSSYQAQYIYANKYIWWSKNIKISHVYMLYLYAEDIMLLLMIPSSMLFELKRT
jgi:hypothetical protein